MSYTIRLARCNKNQTWLELHKVRAGIIKTAFSDFSTLLDHKEAKRLAKTFKLKIY